MASISRDRRSVRAAMSGAWRARAASAPAPSRASSSESARAEIGAYPVADDRLGRLPHVEGGIERARDALDDDHRLLQEHQFGARLHVEEFGHLEQQRQQPRHRDRFGRLAVDRLADGADRLREGAHVVGARHVARLEMHLGDAHDSRA